jgi:hypothetical protein
MGSFKLEGRYMMFRLDLFQATLSRSNLSFEFFGVVSLDPLLG